MESRGVHVIRYADDIVVLARTPRAGQRLLESSRRYLEGKLKLRMNTEKSRVVSVYAIRNFKFLGFALGKGGRMEYSFEPMQKSLKKAKQKLKELTSRSQGRNVRKVMYNVKVFIWGWLGYFGIASMHNTMRRTGMNGCADAFGWRSGSSGSYRRTRIKNPMKLGLPRWRACEVACSRKSYWRSSAPRASVQMAISNKKTRTGRILQYP